jgi:hypothetical protein
MPAFRFLFTPLPWPSVRFPSIPTSAFEKLIRSPPKPAVPSKKSPILVQDVVHILLQVPHLSLKLHKLCCLIKLLLFLSDILLGLFQFLGDLAKMSLEHLSAYLGPIGKALINKRFGKSTHVGGKLLLALTSQTVQGFEAQMRSMFDFSLNSSVQAIQCLSQSILFDSMVVQRGLSILQVITGVIHGNGRKLSVSLKLLGRLFSNRFQKQFLFLFFDDLFDLS